MIEELASLAWRSFGATRDVVDLGWVGYPHQIGLSGKTVSPKLYSDRPSSFQCSISQECRHLRPLSAIKQGQDAQIFKVLISHRRGLFDVVPELIEKLRESEKTEKA